MYQIDDTDILWIHKKGGSARGSRFACLSDKSFFDTSADAEKGIDYLKTCHLSKEFIDNLIIVKVSDLESLSKKTWDLLLSDIEENNESIEFNDNLDKERNEAEELKRKELVGKLLKGSFEEIEDNGEGIYTVTINTN